MSSVGPSIAIITEKTAEDISGLLKEMDLKIAISTSVDNTGITYL